MKNRKIKPKFFHYSEKGEEKKIPILHYLKAGYEKLLPLYLKIRVR